MRPLRLVVFALTMVAVAVPAQAAEPALTAAAVSFTGGAQASGHLSMLYLSDGYLPPDPLVADPTQPASDEASASTPLVDLAAAQVTAWSFSRTFLVGPNGAASQALDSPDPVVQDLHEVALQLSAYQPGFQLHVFALDGTKPYTAQVAAADIVATSGARMGTGSWGKDRPATGQSVSQNPDSFALVEQTADVLDLQTTQPGFSLVVRGDLVLELDGLSLAGDAREGTQQLDSGAFQRPVDPSLPPESMLAASYRERRFLRLFLQDATLEVAAQDGTPDVHWASSDATTNHQGPVSLQGAIGDYRHDGETVALHGGYQVLPAGSHLNLQPEGERIGLTLRPAAPKTQATVVDLASPQSATLVGVGAILALAAAVGVGVVRNLTLSPAMADIERAIEAGHYRRAARLARRVLRKAPGSEDALLARAIALSKAGRSARAVSELNGHLANATASDGALHYVLGLALLELGRDGEGRAALQEAVRRTPSLATEVAARLQPGATANSPAPSLPPSSSLVAKEANGYA